MELCDTYLESLNNNQVGINVKYKCAHQWFELLITIEGAMDGRRQKQEDLSGLTRTNQR